MRHRVCVGIAPVFRSVIKTSQYVLLVGAGRCRIVGFLAVLTLRVCSVLKLSSGYIVSSSRHPNANVWCWHVLLTRWLYILTMSTLFTWEMRSCYLHKFLFLFLHGCSACVCFVPLHKLFMCIRCYFLRSWDASPSGAHRALRILLLFDLRCDYFGCLIS